jgi:alkylation response protein AidB-like acyl-CoA dehydrogenase
MNFVFTDEQRMFQRSVRELLDKACTPAALRMETDGAIEWSSERWRALADLGVTGMIVPERFGGHGRDETDLVLALEELGRAAAPEPAVETCVVVRKLVELGDIGPGAEWLPRIAAGEAAGDYEPTSAGSYQVTLLRSPGEVALRLAGAEARLGGETDPAFDWAAFGTAAVLCGIADRVIELAASYAKERLQFGKPIGSFQAVKHLLADALLGLEFARPAVYRAAWSIANDDPALERDVSMAKALASDAAVNACRSALQVHGAIGYTHEHDLHLWLKKGFSLAHAWGTAAWHRDRVANAVLG